MAPVVAAALLSGCDGGSGGASSAASSADASRLAADCASAAQQLLGPAQQYLDAIGGTAAAAASPAPSGGGPASATGTPSADPAAQERAFTTALADLRGFAASRGCDPARFRDDVSTGLRRLKTGSPVARAVLLQLQAGTNGATPRTTVRPGEDLAAVVAGADKGAVITLAAGEYRLDDTLVLLRGITLQGAGRDATTIRSAAPDGVVLALTGDPVVLRGVTLAHDGTVAASVLSAGPTASVTVSGSRVTGARGDQDGGGIGVLMAAGAAGQTGPSRRTTLDLSDTTVDANAVAGVVVAGEHRAQLRGLTVSGSAQCGVCFLGTSDGVLRDSRFAANAAGVVVAGDAEPVITGVTVDGGEVGLQALDRAAPAVDGATVTGSARAAFLFSGQSAGRVRGSSCDRVPYGIVVGPQAAPEVTGDRCQLARGQ